MGLGRRGQSAMRRRCQCTSLTTSNAEIARNTHAPFGFRRHGGICVPGVESERLTVLGSGFLETPQGLQGHAEITINHGCTRILAQ